MRLYLSSYRLGERPEAFSRLVKGRRQDWIVMNSLDGMDEQRRQADLPLQIQALAGLGLEARELDLRQHTPDTIGGAMPGHSVSTELRTNCSGAPSNCGRCSPTCRSEDSWWSARLGGELFTQVAREGNVYRAECGRPQGRKVLVTAFLKPDGGWLTPDEAHQVMTSFINSGGTVPVMDGMVTEDAVF